MRTPFLCAREPPRRFSGYSAIWRASVTGSSLFPKASMSNPPTRGSIPRSPRNARWSRTATPTMRAAGTARCGRRPRRWRSWTCATASRAANPVAYGETVRIGEVDVGFVPAGHVLGSAQIVLDYRGERVVVSGDYKRRPDPTCAPFVVGAVRHLHHRGDVRPAGVPPSRHRRRDRPPAPPAARTSRGGACWSAPMRWARRSG